MFDPGIFRHIENFPNQGLLQNFSTYAYTEIALVSIVLWYFLASQKSSVLVLGVLFAGVVFSLLLGLVLILPTILMLAKVSLFGALGFTPILTGFVLLRNACRAWVALPRSTEVGLVGLKVAVVTVVALVIPFIPDMLVLSMLEP